MFKNKLKGKIMANGLTQQKVAKELGLSLQSFSLKINSRREFKASEIAKLINLLNLTSLEVNEFFFANDSELKSHNLED
jgi:transcriptional regulator with XRE-family HTH domain